MFPIGDDGLIGPHVLVGKKEEWRMGLYKICEHKGRDRCEHAWWGRFRGRRASLSKWTNREIRSKAEAQGALQELRGAIRSGTFDKRGLRPPGDGGELTFQKFSEIYAERCVEAKELRTADAIEYRLKPLRAFFGHRALKEIRTADIEDYVNRQKGRTLSTASINRSVALLRHMLNWAVAREHLEVTPFRRGGEALIRLEREDNRRRRRLSQDEEKTLLEHAPAHLRPMIITALDTGMRRGEMPSLRFCDIDRTRQAFVLRGTTTKSKKTRFVPIGTARLKAVLEFQRIDGVGEQKPDRVPVFSNATGESVRFFRKAWERALAKAGLSDLRWHDLRHEYASRLAERGVPLSQVRDLLGHASITTTESYDNQTLTALQNAARVLEDGKTFQNLSSSESSGQDPAVEPAGESANNSLSNGDLVVGGPPGDRTQDTVIKSHVLYH
jgi:site-specific recombinase XerD